MNKTLLFLACVILVSAGCKDNRYKKGEHGLEYKIFKGPGGPQIASGNTVKYFVKGFYKDSLLATGFENVPQLLVIDSNFLPPMYVKIFTQMHKGDSVITRMLVDSIMKQNPQMPPYAKKGNYITTHISIVDVYTDTAVISKEKDLYKSKMAETDSLLKAAQIVKDDKILQDYLAKNHINAVKAPKGTYVEITDPGTGEQVDTGKAVSVLYKGTTLDGKIFDQSYDATGKPGEPYTFIVGKHMAIEGWDDGMKLFKKGGKGKLFVPSVLAYGSRGAGGQIKANENLIFEVNVVDVTSGAEYQKKQEEKRKQYMEEQKKMQQQKQQGQSQVPPPPPPHGR
jgi:FKBP-type peptidyl-prolyl cis-trans isomerase FkpA